MRPISRTNIRIAALALAALPLVQAARAAPSAGEPFPPHHLFVAGAFSNNVIEFDEDGEFVRALAPGVLLIELQDDPGDAGDLASTFGQAAVVLRTFERRPAGVEELVAYGSERHFPSETAGAATAALRLLGDLEDGRLEIAKVRGTFSRGSEAGSFSGKLKSKKKLD